MYFFLPLIIFYLSFWCYINIYIFYLFFIFISLKRYCLERGMNGGQEVGTLVRAQVRGLEHSLNNPVKRKQNIRARGWECFTFTDD